MLDHPLFHVALSVCFHLSMHSVLCRAVLVALSAFKSDVSLDVLDHPLLNVGYYTLCEVVPAALVLWILRKLPPKRSAAGYYPIPAA